jgi:hypothetical protein
MNTNLRWSTPAAPCLLCGVEVTPQSWYYGGVVESDRYDDDGETIIRRWQIADWAIQPLHVRESNLTPIFPPRGWAGKTDAELFTAVFGVALPCIADGLGMYAPQKWGCDHWAVNVGQDGTIWCYCRDSCEIEEPEMIKRPEILILALRNALVLQHRLQEATDAK